MQPALPPQVSPPSFVVSEEPPSQVSGADAVALPVLAGPDGQPVLGPGADVLESAGADLFAALEVSAATGRVGQVTRLPVEDRLVLLVGVGAATPTDLRRAAATLARATQDVGTLATSLHTVADDGVRAVVEGLTLGSFGFTMRSTGPTRRPVERVVLAGAPVDAEVLRRAVAVALAGWRSRFWATVPANVKSPQWFCDQAADLAAEAGLAIEVLDEERLAAGGFGGILAVGAGSATPPRLLRLDYRPRRSSRRTPHLALVGKGITFDSGGLSLKPGELMVNMKRDMTGGGVVLATMAALAAVGCPVRVTGLVPLAENVVSASSMRPGDVLTQYGGRTTEVTNTDAEGRLVLADALAYAVEDLDADVLVDVATLTGAAKIAVGQRMGVAFANRDLLFDVLRTAGEEAGEPFWRMPLAEVYEERLASKVADADNAPGSAQAIVAGLFLQHFVAGRPWAHLDIAPVGDAVEDAYEWTSGPTGFGPRALLRWLERPEPLAGLV